MFTALSPLGFCRGCTGIIHLQEKWVFSTPSTCWSGFCSKTRVVWFNGNGVVVNEKKVTFLICEYASFSLSKYTHLLVICDKSQLSENRHKLLNTNNMWTTDIQQWIYPLWKIHATSRWDDNASGWAMWVREMRSFYIFLHVQDINLPPPHILLHSAIF